MKVIVVQIGDELINLEFRSLSRKKVEEDILYETRRLDRLKAKKSALEKKIEEVEFDVETARIRVIALTSDKVKSELAEYEERKVKEKCEAALLDGKI